MLGGGLALGSGVGEGVEIGQEPLGDPLSSTCPVDQGSSAFVRQAREEPDV